MGNNIQLKNIITISAISLLFAHLMVNTFVPSIIINLATLLGIAYFIYAKTLLRNDLFGFLMVAYFMSAFPFLNNKGGGVNLIVFTSVLFYIFIHGKSPILKSYNKSFNLLLALFIVGSILGWVSNYVGDILNLTYSIASFFGIIFLIIIATSIQLTAHRISTFLRLNIVIIAYAIIAFLNMNLGIFKIGSFLLPSSRVVYKAYVEMSGIIGVSPMFGEYNMIMSFLFFSFLLFNSKSIKLNKKHLVVVTILTISTVIASISRSVFLLLVVGMIMMVLFQFIFYPGRLKKSISQFVILSIIFLSILGVIKYTGIGYVFERLDNYEENQGGASGLSLESIQDGSAFNREYAFSLAQEKYNSKANWLLGYGWGLEEDNKYAFYKDHTVLRSSAHTQLYAILFLFGWIGFIGYYGLLFLTIYLSYKTLNNIHLEDYSRIFAYFSLFALFFMAVNGIKADNVSFPNYFAMTMIIIGLAVSNSIIKLNHK